LTFPHPGLYWIYGNKDDDDDDDDYLKNNSWHNISIENNKRAIEH
jgi:hypothetical protein